MKTTEPVVKTTLRTPKTGKNGVICIKVNWKGTRAHESTGTKMSKKDFDTGLTAYIQKISESSALAKAADHIRMTELPPSPPEDLF